ncbi:hypothetical protein PFISCL1PPCAC_19773 [Pristionchus fissidentatus]|uniref:Uncharacterized protein n=1 Tax=Pristionchus fissidentatus TaxID=1538716 RepID=A0AAV5WCB7_9BILA|nr:hypothetical protein PFISCL1PPCAC_19773 [Pristionchus fissidentatus]
MGSSPFGFSMDLKSILKNGAKLIGAGQSKEAYNTLKEAIDGGEEDYRLFCFFALAAANEEKTEEAEEMYRRAIQLDGKTLTAWQGLNKMYSSGQLKVNESALESVEILLKESEESKKEALMKDRRKYLIELSKWSSLSKEDLEAEAHSIPHILKNIISEERKLSDHDKNTATICFSILGENLTGETALSKAIFTYKSSEYSIWSKCVFDGRVDASIDWIKEKRGLALAIEYAMNGEINEQSRCVMREDTEYAVYRFLLVVSDGDTMGASEILDSCKSLDGSLSLSLSIGSLRLLIRDEEYEVAITTIRTLKTNKVCADREVMESLRGLEAECLLRAGDYRSALSLIPLRRCTFGLVEARILIENDKEVDEELEKSLNESERIRLGVRRLMKEGKNEMALEMCNGLDDDEWEDVLLEAECSPPSKAVNMLVRTAKLNTRCSRAFYLLATILRGKNGVKAMSLALRAASIRRNNEEYARLVDELMNENGEDDEKRLNALYTFIHAAISPIPEWARISISRLLLSCKRVDEAIVYLQDGIKECDSALRWALLGDAYCVRGQLSSSINAYVNSLKKEHNMHIVVAMLGVSLRLADPSRTLSMCDEWLDEARETKGNPALPSILLIASQSILNMSVDDISIHLPLLFSHITELVKVATPSSILYKLFGDFLLLLSKTSDSLFSQVSTPVEWKVEDQLSSLKLSCVFYSRSVEMRREEGSYWSDLALSLYLMWKRQKDGNTLERSRSCFIHAIRLSSKKKKPVRSRLWSNLAMIEEARGESVERIRHCLSRSIELDGRNDEAWLRLAVLFWKNGEIGASSECIENATKWNPSQSEGWSLWAEMAWKGGEEKGRMDGEDMMRHSLSLHPTVWGVSRYTQMVCNRIVRGEDWSPTSLLIKMERVLHLKNSSSLSSSEDRLRMAVMAELFGCIEEATELYDEMGESVHRLRNQLKLLCLPSSSSSPNDKVLSSLYELCNESNDRLRELVESSGCVIDPSLTTTVVVKEEEGEEKRERVVNVVYNSLKGKISVPLLVSNIITFNKDLSDAFISALHDLSPRDELIDYFPTVIPPEVDNGIRFIEKDGEEPYRIHNEVARKLYDILKKRRQMISVA